MEISLDIKTIAGNKRRGHLAIVVRNYKNRI